MCKSMKKQTYMMSYQAPELLYFNLELSGFLCGSGLYPQQDEWTSEEGGEFDFNE